MLRKLPIVAVFGAGTPIDAGRARLGIMVTHYYFPIYLTAGRRPSHSRPLAVRVGPAAPRGQQIAVECVVAVLEEDFLPPELLLSQLTISPFN